MIDIELYKKKLNTQYIGKNLLYFDELESTNSKALKLSNQNVENGTVIITDQQIKGRGRQSNKWISVPEKSLTFSIVLYPNCNIEQLNNYSIITGLSISDTLIEIGNNPHLKWPNDVLLEGKKVGGILIESKLNGNFVGPLVIGIGLNVNESLTDFPSELQPITTSINIIMSALQNRERILATILYNLENRLNNIDRIDHQMLDWEDRCGHMNQEVSFRLNNQTIKGEFKGLTESGEAILIISGQERIFNSGELVMP